MGGIAFFRKSLFSVFLISRDFLNFAPFLVDSGVFLLHLGRLGASLGRFWAALGHLGAVLGGLGVVLGSFGWCWDGEFPAPFSRPGSLKSAVRCGFFEALGPGREKGRAPGSTLFSSCGVLCAVLRRPGRYLKQFCLSNTPRRRFWSVFFFMIFCDFYSFFSTLFCEFY